MADLLSEINALIAVGVDPTVAATTVNAERARKAQQGKRKHNLFAFIVLRLVLSFPVYYYLVFSHVVNLALISPFDVLRS